MDLDVQDGLGADVQLGNAPAQTIAEDGCDLLVTVTVGFCAPDDVAARVEKVGFGHDEVTGDVHPEIDDVVKRSFGRVDGAFEAGRFRRRIPRSQIGAATGGKPGGQ